MFQHRAIPKNRQEGQGLETNRIFHEIGFRGNVRQSAGTVRVALDAGFLLAALLYRESCRGLDLDSGSRAYETFKASAVHVIPATPL
jgi:molybdopterin-binding protein